MAAHGGTNMLETPPFFIALVFTFFLVVTLSFEKCLNLIKRYLERRRKMGLLAAMDSMKNELMLLGFATLLLLTLEPKIEKICVPASAYNGRAWLDHVQGCACCLSRTAYVSDCFLQARGCCNSTYMSSCCAITDPGEGDVCAECGPPIAKGVRHSIVYDLGQLETAQCVGRTEVSSEYCDASEDKRPAIGQNALHQVHIFIFVMALCHIVVGIGLILISSLRMRRWRTWTEQDDPHSIFVRSKIAENMHETEMSQLGPSGSLAAAAQQAPVAASAGGAAEGAARSAPVTGQQQERQTQEQAQQRLQQEQLPAPEGSAAASQQAPLSATAGAVEGAASSVPVTGQPQPQQQQQQPPPQHVARLNASAGEQAVAAAAPPFNGATDVNKEAFPGAVPAAAASAALADAGKGAPLDKPALRSALKSKEMAELEEGRAPEGKEGPASAPARQVAGGSKRQHLSSRRVLMTSAPRWRGRPERISRPLLGRLRELALCVARQFTCNIVRREEFHLMRASWYFTHRLDAQLPFDFMQYMELSMEDDYSHMVGLGLVMWIFLVLFIVLSAAIGWCVWVFTIVSGALLFIINTKLVWVVRYLTRGGRVHTLKPSIFWLGRPWLFRPVIKGLLFFVSFVFSNSIYFAAMFGPTSCFFSRTGFQGPQFLPWWLTLCVNAVYLVVLSTTTLPLYSLTVHMGSDYKRALLPRDICARLDAAADERAREDTAEKKKKLRSLISGVFPYMRREAPREGHAHLALTLPPAPRAPQDASRRAAAPAEA